MPSQNADATHNAHHEGAQSMQTALREPLQFRKRVGEGGHPTPGAASLTAEFKMALKAGRRVTTWHSLVGRRAIESQLLPLFNRSLNREEARNNSNNSGTIS